MAAGAALPAAAQDSIFTVPDVKVDVTASDALKAREQAFSQAQQDAFRKLAEQLLPEDEMASFQPPEAMMIGPMIKDFEVTEEHLSSVRYVGTYTFRFDSVRVQAYFGGRGVSYTNVKSRPVLILPFYQTIGRSVLWGGNPWLEAWTRAAPERGLVPIVVPIGDAMDVADIGDGDALSYDPSALRGMLDRYHAGSAAIAVAVVDHTGGLAVSVYRSEGAGPQWQDTIQIPADAAATMEERMDIAARKVRDSLRKGWKSLTAADPANRNSLQGRILFAGMQEWIETQNVLRTVAGVQDVRLLSLRPGEARINLSFSGGEDRLRLALAQAGVTLGAPQQIGYDAGDDSGAPSVIYDLYLDKYRPARPAAGSYADPYNADPYNGAWHQPQPQHQFQPSPEQPPQRQPARYPY